VSALLSNWRSLLAFALAICLCSGAAAAADEYPAKPIQMIVPFPSGGPADIVGRVYAQQLSAVVGQPVVILNPGGAGGTIGTASAARAAPDGYTVLFGSTSTMAINQLIMKQLPYDFAKDFSLIGLVANAPHLLAVREGLPAKTAAELVAMAKRSPGKYTIASAGPGTIVQMAAELFKQQAGIDLLVVPFKGGQPATLALLSGEVDMIINDLTTLKSNLASGKLRALAVANESRLRVLPSVPTFAELGLPGVVSSTWWGIGVPVKTPEAVQAKLRSATAQILADRDYVARLATMAVEPMHMTPEQASAFVAEEVRKWKTVVAAAKIQVD
jgi:tripartite-type tricarboxylate transporter receptor subunit TctC